MTFDIYSNHQKQKNQYLEPARVIDNDAFKIEHYHNKHHYKIHIRHQTHKIIFIMSLHGNIQYASPLEELVGAIEDGRFNLLYYPAKNFELKLSSTGGDIVLIHFDIHHWLSWLPKNDDMRGLIQNSILGKAGNALYTGNQNLTATIRSILQDIRHCQFDNAYLTQYVNAKVLELMVTILQPIPLQKPKENDLPEEEIERMYKAKSILTQNISESCSIINLAQQVGTNECYLKRNFKKVFGDTVYQFLLSERMEKARELIIHSDKKISLIAKMIGYKNASHFSVAYRKHFGRLPNQERGTQ
jgi:AraC-like DNA-binding protein